MSNNKYEPLDNKDDSGFQNEDDEIELNSAVPINLDTRIPEINDRSSKPLHVAIGSLALIMLYLSLSICLTFYQDWVLKKYKFPLSIVLYHLIIKLALSICVRGCSKLLMKKSSITLDFRTNWQNVAPTGIASGIDIGFSNWGLEMVNISLYTMTKSSTIIFILFFAILLGLEKKSSVLVSIVGIIASGLFLFTYKSTQFDALGFSFLLFASFTSGIRWSFAQKIMQRSKLGLHNPIDMIYHMQPWMILSILPFTIGFEGSHIAIVFRQLSDTSLETVVALITTISIGAILAFLMEISEFLALSHTSSLTLAVTGIFKDICQLVIAVEFHGDQLSSMNILGLILCLAGICCHAIHKYSSMVSNTMNISFSKEHTSNEFVQSAVFHKSSRQNIPLLDSSHILESDSEDSSNSNEQSASEVIFDVLKRRDIR